MLEGKGKDKAVPVTGREGWESCDTPRLLHFLDQWSENCGTFTPRR
jgi:hypothetical protein